VINDTSASTVEGGPYMVKLRSAQGEEQYDSLNKAVRGNKLAPSRYGMNAVAGQRYLLGLYQAVEVDGVVVSKDNLKTSSKKRAPKVEVDVLAVLETRLSVVDADLVSRLTKERDTLLNTAETKADLKRLKDVRVELTNAQAPKAPTLQAMVEYITKIYNDRETAKATAPVAPETTAQ